MKGDRKKCQFTEKQMEYIESDGENKDEQHTNAEEQPEDHQHSAEAAQKRSEESPELKMGVQTKMIRTGTEMRPGPGAAD